MGLTSGLFLLVMICGAVAWIATLPPCSCSIAPRPRPLERPVSELR